MKYALLFMSIFMVNSVTLAESVDPLDLINGYWTTNKWGEHQLCIFVGYKVDDAKRFKCFPVPDRVFRQVAA